MMQPPNKPTATPTTAPFEVGLELLDGGSDEIVVVIEEFEGLGGRIGVVGAMLGD